MTFKESLYLTGLLSAWVAIYCWGNGVSLPTSLLAICITAVFTWGYLEAWDFIE